MNCDLRCKNINLYFDLSDLPPMWRDFKALMADFKRVRWYWKPAWILLVTTSVVNLLVMLAFIFILFGLYISGMIIRQGIIKTTPKNTGGYNAIG